MKCSGFLFSPTECEQLKIKEMSKREKEEKMSRGVKRKRAGNKEKEVQSGVEALQKYGTKRKKKKNLRKAKKDGAKESAEGGAMKTRRAEKEKKETETRRETRLGKNVRKYLGEEGYCEVERKETTKREEMNARKRKREEDKQGTVAQKKGIKTEDKRVMINLQVKGKKSREKPENDDTMSTEEGKIVEKEGDERSMGEEETASVDEEVKPTYDQKHCGHHGNVVRGHGVR